MDLGKRIHRKKESAAQTRQKKAKSPVGKRKKVILIENSSSPDLCEVIADSPSPCQQDYDNEQRNFNNIFSNVQSTLRHHSADIIDEEDLLAKFEDDPIIQKSLGISKKSTKASKGLSVAKSSSVAYPSTSKVITSCSTATSSTSSSKSRSKSKASSSTSVPAASSSALDTDVSEAQLAVADLDTDTEGMDDVLEIEEPPKRNTRGRARKGKATRKTKMKPVELPDEDPEVLDAEFSRFMASQRTPQFDIPSTPKSNNAWNMSSSSITYIPDSPLQSDAYEVDTMKIRVKFRDELFKFDGEKNWDVAQVRQKLCELTKVPENELIIYNQEEVKLSDGKTLQFYGVGEGDFLEALRQKIEVPTEDLPAEEGGIFLKFQKNGLKRPITLSISKFKSFQDIRSVIALELKLDHQKLELHFDGEKISLGDTPEDLELEDDYCIDIHEIP